MNDQELVRKTIAGDHEAYRVLVEKYQAPLLRYTVYLIHDPDMAEDAVQEAFIRAYRNLRGYNPKWKFSSWLYRIAHNTAMDALPDKRQVPLDGDKEPTDQDGNAEHDSVRRLDSEFASGHVRGCLAALDLKYREPVALFYLEHKSYDEISEILHLSVSAVGVRISRAKQKLQAICEARGVKA